MKTHSLPVRSPGNEPDVEALVSPEDHTALAGYTWRLNPAGYAYRTIWLSGENRNGKVYMHRQITGCPQGLQVDHINKDRLDNRRENLRICTRSQNNAANRKRKGGSSQYRGVSFSKDPKHRRKPWIAQIQHQKKNRRLGRFDNEEAAARRYDEAARKLFGEFANLNFPDDQDQAL